MRVIGVLVVGVVLGAGGMAIASRHDDGEAVKVVSTFDVKEKLDGNETRATVVEVTIEPGRSGLAHRHPGPGFVYVLEGEYELGIDDQPTKTYKAGEVFYEPTNCLHRVSRNPAREGKTRLMAVVLHPRNVHEITVPEPKQP